MPISEDEALEKLLPAWRAGLPVDYASDFIDEFVARNRTVLLALVDRALTARRVKRGLLPRTAAEFAAYGKLIPRERERDAEPDDEVLRQLLELTKSSRKAKDRVAREVAGYLYARRRAEAIVLRREGWDAVPMMLRDPALVIVEADELVETGDIDPDQVMTPAALVDLIVVAGDNLFSGALDDYVKEAQQKGVLVGVYDVGDLQEIRKYNNLGLDPDGRITFFEEKPEKPVSTITAIALYHYPRGVLPLIRSYLRDGNNPDQPGRLVQWLYPRVPCFTYRIEGTWLDIGSRETYDEAQRIFGPSGGTSGGTGGSGAPSAS